MNFSPAWRDDKIGADSFCGSLNCFNKESCRNKELPLRKANWNRNVSPIYFLGLTLTYIHIGVYQTSREGSVRI